MAEIQMIFPKKGVPTILNETLVLNSGEHVTWRVTTNNEKIDSVKVKFGDSEAVFFTRTGPDPFGSTDFHEYRQPVKNCKAAFYGHVPGYPGATIPVFAKYTVSAYDAKGKLIPGSQVDPEIITPRP
jgi:hypothetical protein